MRRYLSPGWLLGHTVALVLFVACLALGWWQVTRAGEGNLRSYAYAVEWPVFAGFVAYVWYREVRRAANPTEPEKEPANANGSTSGRDATDTTTAATTDAAAKSANADPAAASSGATATANRSTDHRSATSAVRTAQQNAQRLIDSDDEEVAEYNRMLAWLNANPGRRISDYPG